MSKRIEQCIKVSIREIPLAIKMISLAIIIYCMASSIAYANLGFYVEGFGYPTLSYNYMVYGIVFTVYINYVFSIYNDNKTSMKELLIISGKGFIGYNYFLKNISMIFICLIPLIILVIPTYMINKNSLGSSVNFILHLFLCLAPGILFLTFSFFISTTNKNPIYYTIPIIYFLVIDPGLTVGANWKFSFTSYLKNYAIIGSIKYLYIVVILEVVFSCIFILISYNYLKRRRGY